MQLLPLPVDQLVGKSVGTYRVEQLLGHGNVNAIYAARQQGSDRPVMLTTFILPGDFPTVSRQRFMARFAQEAAALVKLSHPHILPVYEFGEQYGYPYMITPLVTTGSLAKALKQQIRFTPEQTLEILKPVAAGLDFAHSNGVVHGMLKPMNILLLEGEPRVQIAGFGLVRMLEMRGIEELDYPYAHLYSIAKTFLGAPEYMAPEVVLGAGVDARADIYALGVVLFELLSGRLPFTGNTPVDIALQHVQQPVPSLQTLSPDVPPALDLVVQRALERDPGQRFQSASKLVSAFERVLTVIQAASAPVAKREKTAEPTTATKSDATLPPTVDWLNEGMERNATLPPTINWFDDETASMGKWQGMLPTTTGQGPAVDRPAPALPSSTPFPSTPLSASQVHSSSSEKTALSEDGGSVDPFVWWSTASIAATKPPEPGTFTAGQTNAGPAQRKRAPDKGRRRTVALLATGGVLAAGALTFGGISLARVIQHSGIAGMQPNAQLSQSSTMSPMSSTQGATGTAQKTPTNTTQPTSTAKTTQNAQPTPTTKPTSASTPTMQPTTPPTPTPTPAPPAHTGTVIGSTNQGTNSAKTFSNPADGRGALLIHLPGGNFVAYERACTHQGVPVNYNASTQKLVCPAHGAIFDPANGASVVQGPANAPLRTVPIHVNADGTITTG